jgi:hypothetical protein
MLFMLIENGLRDIQKSFKLLSKYFVFLSFIFFIGCRGYVAQDWVLYYPFFKSVPSLFLGLDKIYNFLSTRNAYEVGYACYNIILKTISANYLMFQFISVAIDYFILDRFFNKYMPKYYAFCFLLYFIFQGLIFEIILLRNVKSILLFLISLDYLYNRKALKYFLLNILGLLFHSSAIIYFPCYFLLNKRINKRILFFIFIIGNIIYLFQIAWLKKILIALLSPLDLGRYSLLLNSYLHSDYYQAPYGITIGYLERFTSFLVIYFCIDNIIFHDKRMTVFWNAFVLYSFFYLFFSEFYIIIERIPNLFVFSYWVLYPKIFDIFSKNKKMIFMTTILVYGILKLIIMNDEVWAYYENIFFGVMDPIQRKQYFTTN